MNDWVVIVISFFWFAVVFAAANWVGNRRDKK